jgi:hypothetical protein
MSILGTVASFSQIGIQALTIKPQRMLRTENDTSITVVSTQITLEEVHSDEMEITDHPVEQGSVISDHAFARPSEVILTIAWSNSPSSTGLGNQLLGAAANASPLLQKVIGAAELVNGISAAFSSGDPVTVQKYRAILQLYNDRRIFDVYTGKRVYKNMLIKSLATTTDAKTANSLILRVGMRRILMAQTQTVTVPDSSNMKNPEQNGATVNKGTAYPLPSPNINTSALPQFNSSGQQVS